MTTPVTATVVNPAAAGNPTGFPAFYLEMLRTAHVAAVKAGIPLVGGKAMGLGGRIRARDKTLVPEESPELDAKANELLAQFGLDKQQVVDLLVNQFGVTQEELAYAWDVPAYPVMREGVQQEPQAAEFFDGNPLEPGHYTAGAYRPNNWFTHRQGSNLAPKAEEIYGRGGDPRRPGVQTGRPDEVYQLMGDNLADLYPQGYGVNYQRDLVVPNTPLEWALEGTVGAMFGPTGRALMRAGGGRLFRMMARDLDVLPPALRAKFADIARIFDPNWKPPKPTPTDRLHAGPLAPDESVTPVGPAPGPDLRMLEGGGESSPRRLFDQDLGPQRSPQEGGRTFDIPENMAERPDADVIPLRPDAPEFGVYDGMTLLDVADLHNVGVGEMGPQHIQEMLDFGAIPESVAADLQKELSKYRAWMAESPENRAHGLRQGGWESDQQRLFDQVDDVRSQLKGTHAERIKYPPGTFKDKTPGAPSVLDDFDPIEVLQPFGPEYRSIDVRIGDIEFTLHHYGMETTGAWQEGAGKPTVGVSWEYVGVDPVTRSSPMNVRMGTPGLPEALRELDKVVKHLVANGVRVEAQVDSGNAYLVNLYRDRGFTIIGSDPVTGEAHVVPALSRVEKGIHDNKPGGAYRNAGYGFGEYFQVHIDPAERFHQAAMAGDFRAALGRPFVGEAEWLAVDSGGTTLAENNYWALGKINGYTDDDIAHFYLVKAMEEYAPDATTAPFWGDGAPGRDPLARSHNLQWMESVPDDVIDYAYKMMRDDRAATGFGYTKPDGTVAPAVGREGDWAAFDRTVSLAALEKRAALMEFGGSAHMRPKHGIGDVRISDVLRVRSVDGNVRDIVIVEMPDGTMQPFYRRTGQGNALGDEALLATGGGGGAHMWVPFDGFGQYGMDRHWFRKSRFTEGDASDPLYRYGTQELKDAGDALDQYFLMNEGSLGGADDWTKGEVADFDGVRVSEVTEVTPNDMRTIDEGFMTPEGLNEELGVHNMDEYSRLIALDDAPDMTPMVEVEIPESLDDMAYGRSLPGTNWQGSAYGVGALGAMGATEFLSPMFSQETTFEDALMGTAPQPQPVHGMLAWQAENNDGWWSWIKDYPQHLEWMAKATAATMDALEKTGRSTNNQVLDGLGDGFREQAFGLATQLKESAVPLVGREDPELLKGVSRDLSQNGHNGHEVFPNDVRREIENGDAMIVGYRSDEDYQRAVGAAGRYGVVVDGNYWRRPSDNSLKPREGEEWTREHLMKMATSGFFGGAR